MERRQRIKFGLCLALSVWTIIAGIFCLIWIPYIVPDVIGKIYNASDCEVKSCDFKYGDEGSYTVDCKYRGHIILSYKYRDKKYLEPAIPQSDPCEDTCCKDIEKANEDIGIFFKHSNPSRIDHFIENSISSTIIFAIFGIFLISLGLFSIYKVVVFFRKEKKNNKSYVQLEQHGG